MLLLSKLPQPAREALEGVLLFFYYTIRREIRNFVSAIFKIDRFDRHRFRDSRSEPAPLPFSACRNGAHFWRSTNSFPIDREKSCHVRSVRSKVESQFVYFSFFFFISLNNINVSRRNKRRNNVCVEVSRARPQRSFEAIARSIKIETLVVSSLNYRLINLISRRRFDLFPFFSLFENWKKRGRRRIPIANASHIFPETTRKRSVDRQKSHPCRFCEHDTVDWLYSTIIGEKRMLLFRERNQRAVSPSIAQRGIVHRQQWNRAKRS